MPSPAGHRRAAHMDQTEEYATAAKARWWLQGLYVASCFLFMCQATIIIPDSLALAKDLGLQGWAPVFSGLLIGSSFFLFGLTFVLVTRKLMLPPWNQYRNFLTILGAHIGYIIFGMVYVLAANPPDSADDPRVRAPLLVLSRLGLGVCGALNGGLLRQMALLVTPHCELVFFNMMRTVVGISLGVGFGPFVSAGVNQVQLVWAAQDDSQLSLFVFFDDSLRSKAAIPSFVIAACILVLIFVYVAQTPREQSRFDYLVRHKERLDVEHADPASDEPKSPGGIRVPASAITARKRQQLWMYSLLVGMERVLLVSGLEAATSMLLEMEFGQHSLSNFHTPCSRRERRHYLRERRHYLRRTAQASRM